MKEYGICDPVSKKAGSKMIGLASHQAQAQVGEK